MFYILKWEWNQYCFRNILDFSYLFFPPKSPSVIFTVPICYFWNKVKKTTLIYVPMLNLTMTRDTVTYMTARRPARNSSPTDDSTAKPDDMSHSNFEQIFIVCRNQNGL